MHNIVYQGAQIAGSVVVTIFGLGQLSSIFTIASYIADSATTQIHDYIDTRNHGKGAKITYYISRGYKTIKKPVYRWYTIKRTYYRRRKLVSYKKVKIAYFYISGWPKITWNR